MSDRTVRVSLVAQVNSYLSGMEQAAKKTRELGIEAEKLSAKAQAFETLGKASMGLGISAAAAVALAVAKYAEFDSAMSNVQAATQASAEDQKLLSAAALEAGASTVFSATESAKAIEELSKAGLDTADIMGGALAGSLDLASAGQLGVARAAEISATALQQFSLDGDQAGHVADVLAAGAGKAMGSVDDLAAGLKFAGPVANDLGVSLEETTGVLALFAQQGIIGEQAGTGLRAVLSSLTSPSAQAGKEIERLGINLYDANGKFLGMENAAGELSKAYSGMDDASRAASMGIVFGRETITAATALYKAGAGGVDEWTRAVDDSGYAAQVARDRLDNLKGDVEALGGAFDTALIQTGAAGNDVLRAMTQNLTDVIDLYNQAPEPMKAVVLAAGGVTAAVGLAGGAFFLGAPKVAQFNAALASMGPNAQKAGAALTASAGPIGIALAAASVGLALFAANQADAKARTDAFTDTLDKQSATLTDATRDLAATSLAADKLWLGISRGSAYDAAEKLGISLDDVTDAALGSEAALNKVNDAYDKINTGNLEQADAYKILIDTIDEQAGSLTEAQRTQLQMNKAQKEGVEASTSGADALELLSGKADDAKNDLDALAGSIRDYGAEQLNVNSATRDYEQAIDDLEASLKENGSTLDLTTQKGRDNQAALDAIALSTLGLAAATVEQTGKSEDANAVIANGRTKLLEMLEPLGIVGDAANTYADELGLIPDSVKTVAELDTSDAERKAANFKILMNSIQRRLLITLQGTATGLGGGMADGGAVYGVGGPRQDNILTRLSVGEHVFDAEDVKRMGGQANVYKFRESLYSRGMADGGAVGVYGGAYGYGVTPQYASNNTYNTVNSGPSEVVLNGATLIVKDVNGQLIGRMQVEADQRIQTFDQSNQRRFRRGLENGYRG